ncbi:g3284 [Coccomyxa elongata]
MPDPLRDVFQALQRAPPPKVEEVHDNMADAFDNIAKEAEKLTPWALMTAGTKNQVKGILTRNWTKIAGAFIQGSIYCALWNHATEELKRRTQKRRRLNRALTYTFDVLLPAPIYAPLFGFLIRLALPF